jgi:hypothetical protein
MASYCTSSGSPCSETPRPRSVHRLTRGMTSACLRGAPNEHRVTPKSALLVARWEVSQVTEPPHARRNPRRTVAEHDTRGQQPSDSAPAGEQRQHPRGSAATDRWESGPGPECSCSPSASLIGNRESRRDNLVAGT